MGKKPKKEIKPKKIKPGQLVYQLLISIIDIEPPIWRRIQVTGDTVFSASKKGTRYGQIKGDHLVEKKSWFLLF
jgi:hypothetical protein